jgi:hypothetical protein
MKLCPLADWQDDDVWAYVRCTTCRLIRCISAVFLHRLRAVHRAVCPARI